jgi:hypothetical protein
MPVVICNAEARQHIFEGSPSLGVCAGGAFPHPPDLLRHSGHEWVGVAERLETGPVRVSNLLAVILVTHDPDGPFVVELKPQGFGFDLR